MELKKIILDSARTEVFIRQHMKDCSFDPVERDTENHSLRSYNINKCLAQKKQLTLAASEVTDIFSFKEEDKYALYILLELAEEKMNALLSLIGEPKNESREKALSLQFQFLYWRINNLDVLLRKHRSGKDAAHPEDIYLLLITNVEHARLVTIGKVSE